MSALIFISHSSKDDEVAKTICSALESRGLTCWIASRDVGPGENFQEAIVRAIRVAKVMVLVFTDAANGSREITKELALASQHKLVVIPARVENAVPSEALAYELATRQWINLFANWEVEIERLTAWIKKIAATSAPLDASPEVAPESPTTVKVTAANAAATGRNARLSQPSVVEPAPDATARSGDPAPAIAAWVMIVQGVAASLVTVFAGWRGLPPYGSLLFAAASTLIAILLLLGRPFAREMGIGIVALCLAFHAVQMIAAFSLARQGAVAAMSLVAPAISLMLLAISLGLLLRSRFGPAPRP